MYLVNNFYLEALKKDDIRVKARIETNDSDTTINNDDISSIKYNLSIMIMKSLALVVFMELQ